ncbi:22288_t:CDS:2 [Gigaspora margarita]|uniref:22288_t:CDS:1 n=1 Tax=Gigaspora margarita TaxID=4874 RepID=A0ABN7VDN5_GIGMA|nr:22288_t:CDS:2 [Gigaspora margarita]
MVKINNSYENNTLQQMEQTNMNVQTTPVVDNEDPNKQSWAKMMDNDSDNLKDINNETNPWVIPSTNETSIEHTNTENSILHNNQEGTLLGIESLLEDSFLENIDDILGLPEQETEIRNPYAAQEPIRDSNHEHENMQAEVTQQEATAELAEVAINVENEEMVVEPSDTAKVAKEEDTHEEAVKTPTNTGASPDEEMVAEPSDPLKDELLNLYGTTENKENLPPVAVTKDINVEDVQASMFLQ